MTDSKIAVFQMFMSEIAGRGRRGLLVRLMVVFAAAALLCFPSAAIAQTGQGIISGIITDQVGASVTNAQVEIRNTTTNVILKATTNDTGYYEVRGLNPGPYEVSVVASGFERSVRPNIDLLADGHPSIDITLKVGSSNETVTVTDAAPLIDTQSVSIGQVITSEEMSGLPNGQSPIWLAMISPGVQSNYAQNYSLGGASTSWNGAGPQFGAYGRIGANEFSLDGAPNMANQRGQAINLSAEELGQTSVNITQFDASVGHTYGISLTQTTKSGTNQLHGGIRYRRYDLRFFGMQHFQRSNYLYNLQKDNCNVNPNSTACQTDQSKFGWPGSHANYGDAGIGGPVYIPKLFDGRNRLFFFVGVIDEIPTNAGSNTINLPTARQKGGDFSDLTTGTLPTKGSKVETLFNSSCAPGTLYYGQYQLYNPYRVTIDSTGVPHRKPFCGNVLPSNLISNLPMVKIINSALPDANLGPASGNNYLYMQGQKQTYRAVTNRYDYAATDADHIFFRWTRGHYTKLTQNFLNGGLGDSTEDRWISTGAAGWSHVLSSKTVLDVNVGATQWTGSGFNYPGYQKYKPSTLGLPTYVDDYAGQFAQFPFINISNIQSTGNTYLAVLHYRTLAVRGNVTSVRGNHTIRAGGEWRQQNVAGGGPQASNNVGGPSGQFNFDNTYVQENNNTDGTFPQSSTGTSYASFLLGIQTTATVTSVPALSRSNPYYAFYVGDTWRVTRKLTLTPGIRYEFEYGPTEKHNRQIVGWDPNAQLEFAGTVNTAYKSTLAAANAAQRAVLPASLPLQGGPIYAGVNGASTRQWVNNWRFLPRIGAAYSVNPRTVLRFGTGYYYDTLDALNESGTVNSDGYTATTSVASSTNFGTDFVPGVSPMANPFPVTGGTRFVSALGNALGANYYTGNTGTVAIYDHNRVPARSLRFQASVERQLGNSMMVQVAYVASRTTHITLDGNNNNTRTGTASYINATSVPAQFFTGGTQPNSATNALLGQSLPNPFYIAGLSGLQTSDPVYYNVLSKSSYITSKTIQIQNLVRPYPQMSQLRFYNSIGGSQFQELQVNFSKRMSNGLVANVSYQKNYQKDRDYFENTFDTHPSLESSIMSPPWRLTASWVYNLPFGRNRQFARDGWKSALFGGFQLSGSVEANPGSLLTFAGNGSGAGTPNIFFIGDPNSIRLKKWVYNTSAATPTVYGFNAQAVTATSASTNSVTTCNYTGTGFVLPTSTPSGAPSCTPTNYNLRVFPIHVEGVRAQGVANWNANLARTLNPNERVKLEIRADLLNLFNHQRLAAVGGGQMNPSDSRFGQITSDNGNGRQIILQALMTF